jgi:predicted kinase
MTKILLITGPAGVGKSTLSWEVSARLTAAGLRHAAIETDELDRIFPLPSASELQELRPGMTDVSEINLASIWGNYRALGYDRLILSGVMVFLDETRKWISRAIPNAEFTIVRLLASNETLLSRLEKREIGPGHGGSSAPDAETSKADCRHWQHWRHGIADRRQNTSRNSVDALEADWVAHQPLLILSEPLSSRFGLRHATRLRLRPGFQSCDPSSF